MSNSVIVTTATLRLPPPTPLPLRFRLCSHHPDLRWLISYLDSFALHTQTHTHTRALTHTHWNSSAALSYLRGQTSPLQRWPSNPVFHRFSSSFLPPALPPCHLSPEIPNIIIPSACTHDLITRSRPSGTSLPLSASHLNMAA